MKTEDAREKIIDALLKHLRGDYSMHNPFDLNHDIQGILESYANESFNRGAKLQNAANAVELREHAIEFAVELSESVFNDTGYTITEIPDKYRRWATYT